VVEVKRSCFSSWMKELEMEFKMRTKIFTIVIASIFVMVGCNSESTTEVVEAPNYTGQYQSVPYESSQADNPTVILLLSQEGNKLSGTGNWNGITFNFEGTLIEKHMIVTFTLKGTNYGEINGNIDSWVGNDKSLAGGFQLWNSATILTGAIRFKHVHL
jgi:hypothetical protein